MEGIQEYIERFDKNELRICTCVITEAEMMDHKFT